MYDVSRRLFVYQSTRHTENCDALTAGHDCDELTKVVNAQTDGVTLM